MSVVNQIKLLTFFALCLIHMTWANEPKSVVSLFTKGYRDDSEALRLILKYARFNHQVKNFIGPKSNRMRIFI